MASIPTRNILLLITAAVAGLFFAFHGFVVPPWELVAADASLVALGTWAVAPCALAAVATLVGGVELRAGRTSRLPQWLSEGLSAVVPMVALALMAALHEPAAFRSQGWVADLLPIAVVVGLGFGLCTLFWQGVVQLRLGQNMVAPVRALMVIALAAAIWAPFWIRTESLSYGFGLWIDLVILSTVAAVLFELGNSTRLVMALTALTAAAAVYVHHVPFL